MKILITGSNGYIGKSLTKRLHKKHNVTVLTRQEVDLRDSQQVNNFFKNKFFDAVIHCAIVGGSRLKEDTWNELDTNLIMFYNLLQNKQSYNKFINFGSGAELFCIETPYGLSKNIIYKSILSKENFFNIRVFGVFDENELNTRFIKSSILNYINKKTIIIHDNILMDFFYIYDLFKLVEFYLECDGPKTVDCTYNKTYSLLEIAEMINSLSSHKVNVKILSNTKKIYHGTPCPLSLNFIGLKTGLEKTFSHLK